MFGLEFSEYRVDENDKELILNIILYESELAIPVSLNLSPSDISAGDHEFESSSGDTKLILLVFHFHSEWRRLRYANVCPS